MTDDARVPAVCGRSVLAESADETVSSLSLLLRRVDSVDGRGVVDTAGAGGGFGFETGAGAGVGAGAGAAR